MEFASWGLDWILNPPPPQTKEKRKLSLHNSVQHDRTQSSVFLRNQTSRNNRNWEKQMSDVVCVCVCDRRFLAFKVTSFVRPQVGPGATRRWRHRGAYGPNNLQSPLAGNAFGPSPPPPSNQEIRFQSSNRVPAICTSRPSWSSLSLSTSNLDR